MDHVHGTCVALGQVGVLLRGDAGSGKSDLALRLIDGGARLVADDQVELMGTPPQVIARCPAPLWGLLEVRGLGLIRLAPGQLAAEVAVRLVVDLVAAGTIIERLPEPSCASLHGCELARLALAPFESSAAAKVRLAARVFYGDLVNVLLA